MSVLIIKSEGLNEVGDSINRLASEATGNSVKQAMGGAVRLKLINHFTELESDGLHHRSADRLGAEHSGFWADAARNVQVPQIEGDNIAIGINKLGLRLRYYGGTVTPGKSLSWKTGKPTQWLSIPAVADAYGKRTQEFDFSAGGVGNLHFVFFRPDLAALVENLASVIKKGRNGVYKHVASTIGTVIFWLKKSLTYKADPTVLPTDKEMLDAAEEAGQEQLLNIWERQFGGTGALRT